MPKKYELTNGTVTLDYAKICGVCDFDSRILIDYQLRGKLLLDTIIHEVLHHECPQATEEEVTRIATSVANVLHGEGWRQPVKKKPKKRTKTTKRA